MEQNSETNNKTLSYLTNSAQQKNLLQFKTMIYPKYFWRQYVSGTIALLCLLFVCFWCNNPPQWARASSFTRFLDHTQWRNTVGRPPLDEWSARCRDLYLTTHNTHNRQTSMPPVRSEPIISAGEWPQTYALDRTTTEIGALLCTMSYSCKMPANSCNNYVHLYLQVHHRSFLTFKANDK